MAKVSPAQLKKDLTRVIGELEARHGARKVPEFTDFVEALLWQILDLGVPERLSKDALKRIKEEFVDWNDLRVATVRELQDILGPKYPRCRTKAEDIHSLTADLYTAFRRMDLTNMVGTPEGIQTLRALPDTTLVRVDMVETALLLVCKVKTFPCDDDQFALLRHLKGVPKNAERDEWEAQIVEALDDGELLRLSRGLREHADFYLNLGEDDPQDLDWQPAPAEKKPKRKVTLLPPPPPSIPASPTVPPPALSAKPQPKPPALSNRPQPKPVTPAPAAAPVAAPAKAEAKPAVPAKTEAKAPAAKPAEAAKPAAKAEAKPATKPAEKAPEKAPAKADKAPAKAPAKAEPKTPAKAAAKAPAKAEAKKPEAKKPAPKAEAKKPEAKKPEAKKPAAKPAPKPAGKAAAKPAAKVPAKPAPKGGKKK